MAKFAELNESSWQEWLADRPQVIQDMAAKWPPNLLYRMRETGQYVTLKSYGEDGTVRVRVEPGFRYCDIIPIEVFGVDPNGLEDCEMPERLFSQSPPTAPIY